MLIYVLLIFAQAVRVSGDYECLCNLHSSGLEIYNKPDNNSQIVGTLQQFSCKPTYASGGQGMWKAIQYKRQIGFVLTDLFTNIEICQGSPQNRDLVAALATLITTQTTTSLVATATPVPTLTRSTATTPVTATSTTQKKTTTPLVATTTPVPTLTRLTATTPVTTTSTTQIIALPTTPIPHGDVSKCPSHVRKDAIRTNGYLDQYDQYCFVLDPQADTWTNAEKHCTLRGGHLLTIRNAEEQEFFTNYLKSHHYVESVFIGLRDDVTEGTYTWASGAPVTYTNWAPDYYSPQHSHASDDCVVMRADGQWDDVSCGIGLIGGIGIFEKHHFICQYGFDATLPSIFGAIGSIIGKRRK